MTIDYEKFDWFDVLERLTNGELIGHEDSHILDVMAAGWPTCACGQLCKALPRDSAKVPMDMYLRALGGQFALQISDRNWGAALGTFNKIEERSARLLGVRLVRRKPAVAPVTTESKPFAVTMGHKRLNQETQNRKYA